MPAKLPKDTQKLIRFICENGGTKRYQSGEVIVEYPGLWKVRTKVRQRRKDSSRKLYRLAKAVAKQVGKNLSA